MFFKCQANDCLYEFKAPDEDLNLTNCPKCGSVAFTGKPLNDIFVADEIYQEMCFLNYTSKLSNCPHVGECIRHGCYIKDCETRTTLTMRCLTPLQTDIASLHDKLDKILAHLDRYQK